MVPAPQPPAPNWQANRDVVHNIHLSWNVERRDMNIADRLLSPDWRFHPSAQPNIISLYGLDEFKAWARALVNAIPVPGDNSRHRCRRRLGRSALDGRRHADGRIHGNAAERQSCRSDRKQSLACQRRWAEHRHLVRHGHVQPHAPNRRDSKLVRVQTSCHFRSPFRTELVASFLSCRSFSCAPRWRASAP